MTIREEIQRDIDFIIIKKNTHTKLNTLYILLYRIYYIIPYPPRSPPTTHTYTQLYKNIFVKL
jgi:hypothetical protein